MLLGAFGINRGLSTLVVGSMHYFRILEQTVSYACSLLRTNELQATECWKGAGNKASLVHFVHMVNVDWWPFTDIVIVPLLLYPPTRLWRDLSCS